MSQNPYSSPVLDSSTLEASSKLVTRQTLPSTATADELQAYIGWEGLDRMIRWLPEPLGNGKPGGQSYGLGMLNAVWFGYRRHYREAWLSLLCFIGIWMTLSLIFTWIDVILSFLNLKLHAAPLALGLVSFHLGFDRRAIYVKRLQGVLQQSRGLGLAESDRLAWIRKRGGTSLVSAVLFGLLTALIGTGAIFVSLWSSGLHLFF